MKGMNFFRGVSIAVAVALVATGCAKKPKLNLANLRNNGAEIAGNSDAGKDPLQGFNFVPATNDSSPDFQPANKTNGGNAGNGEWSSMDTPVAGNDPAANFIANATEWGKKVYFDYNRHEIKASERPVLDELANYLTENSKKGIVIEGHCDERGSDEYNRALSEKRAIAIKDYLANLGIAADRMMTVPCGEDKPDVPNARSPKEHAKNRRGQFQLGDKK
ncbi:MAG: OmpA family protein [Victivallales bacterium]|nr:OmpA family protein [Victivallales bacterium]